MNTTKQHQLESSMFLGQLYKKSILVLAILMFAGYAGNYFSFQPTFAISFKYGSIAVLLVVYLFGTKWGTLAAIIASLPNILLQNYLYEAFVGICEAWFVGLLLRRMRQQNLVFLDWLYWVCIGLPFAWLFNSGILHLDATQMWHIGLKQFVNGIHNALIVNLIIIYFPSSQLLGTPPLKTTHSLRQLLLNLIVLLAIFPLLILIVFDSHRVMTNIENKIQVELKFAATDLIADFQSWQQRYLHALSKLAELAAESDLTEISSKNIEQNATLSKQADRLQQSTKLIQQTFPDFHNVYIADSAARIIASYPTNTTAFNLTIDNSIDNDLILKQAQDSLQPSISDIHTDKILPISHVDVTVPVVVGGKVQGFSYASLDLSYISKLLKSHVFYEKGSISFVDRKGYIVASTKSDLLPMQRLNRKKDGDIRWLDSSIYMRSPKPEKLSPLERWQKSFYVQEIPIDGNISGTLVVEVPAAKYVSYLHNLYIDDLTIALFITALALVFGLLLSRYLAQPLSKLAGVTNNLPHKLLEQEAIDWPYSSVTEIESLINNFKLMAIALEEKFREIQSANETLEQRVRERTEVVLDTTQQLASGITKRQSLEAQLQLREQELSDFCENGTIGLDWIGSDGTILWTNQAELDLLGYSREEYVGNSIINFHADREVIDDILQKLTANEKLHDYEARLVCKDGVIKYVLINSNVFWENGEFIHTRCFTRDITDRKQAEAEMRYALEKEKQLNDLKSRFITTASHEFRTPLTTILLSAELLENYAAKLTEEKKSQYFNRIQIATKHITHLLDDVLLVGQAQAGKLEFNPKSLDLNKFCRELVEEMQINAGNRHIINLEILGQPTKSYLDEKLLRCILSNLISNAIKYSPKGGNINFDLIWKPAEVIFQIQDRGIGIPDADQAKLFDSFHRGSNISTIQGTGLGLAIVKQCVDLHSGEITVNSEVGIGSTFTVTLPILNSL